MNITVQLDFAGEPADLTISKLFDSITSEQRLEIVRQIALETLKEPFSSQRKAREAEVMNRIRAMNSARGWPKTDEEIRNGHEFAEAMGGWMSPQDRVLAKLSEAMRENVERVIAERLRTDDRLDKTIRICAETVVSRLPQLVLAALTAQALQQFDILSNAMLEATRPGGASRYDENPTIRNIRDEVLKRVKEDGL